MTRMLDILCGLALLLLLPGAALAWLLIRHGDGHIWSLALVAFSLLPLVAWPALRRATAAPPGQIRLLRDLGGGPLATWRWLLVPAYAAPLGLGLVAAALWILAAMLCPSLAPLLGPLLPAGLHPGAAAPL